MVNPNAVNPSGLDLNATIGALLLGGLISSGYASDKGIPFRDSQEPVFSLYGITSTQTVVYFQRYHGDCRGTRAAVCVSFHLQAVPLTSTSSDPLAIR